MKITCKNLSKVFHTKRGTTQALSGIDFRTGETEFLCIIGPSGCGKTTLLRIIAGLLKPTEGEVIYEDIGSNNIPLASMVFQEHGIFPWMTVLDNVSFGLEMQGVPKKKRYEASMEFIEKAGLAEFTKNFPHELSVGMKQRVGLARAFVNNPQILLMDEPFGSLDAQMKLILQKELLKIWADCQKNVIYVTHDMEEAILLGDRVIVLTSSPGRIKKEIQVNLRRPRSLDLEGTEEFTVLKTQIWNIIEDEVQRSIAQEG